MNDEAYWRVVSYLRVISIVAVLMVGRVLITNSASDLPLTTGLAERVIVTVLIATTAGTAFTLFSLRKRRLALGGSGAWWVRDELDQLWRDVFNPTARRNAAKRDA